MDRGEREGDPAQAGAELLVGGAGDQEDAVGVGEIGDGHCAQGVAHDVQLDAADVELFSGFGVLGDAYHLPRVVGGGRILDRGPGEGDVAQRHLGERTVLGSSDEEGDGVGAAAAHDREVSGPGDRMDRQIPDDEVVPGAAEPGGEPGVQVVDVDRAGGVLGVVADGDREDGGAHVVGHEEDAHGPEGQWPDGLEIRGAGHQPVLLGNLHVHDRLLARRTF